MRTRRLRGLAAALALGAFAFGTLSATAQTTPDPARPSRDGRPAPTARAERGGDRVARLADRLSLTPDQTARARTLFERQRTEAEALRSRNATDRAGALRTLRERTDRDFQALLTPEQRTRYAALRTEGRAQMAQRNRPADRAEGRVGDQSARGARGARPDPAAHLARLTETLSLTERQQTQVRALFDRQRTEAQTLRERNATPEARRDAMRALATRTQADLRALLTPEQRTEYDALRTRREGRMERRPNHQPGRGPGREGAGRR